MTPSSFLHSQQTNKSTEKMPVLFVGHGSPMNAIEENVYSNTWVRLGKELPTPSSILCISAHWISQGVTQVTAMENPKTIYDFYGFPDELYQISYAAHGSPSLAQSVVDLVTQPSVGLDQAWGLDHGTWSVLHKMYPNADIPVVQLSLDYDLSPQAHFDLAKQLRSLREKGVLIIGSGNIVHNLGKLRMDGTIFDWAIEFDETMSKFLLDRNDQGVVDFLKLGALARTAHPTYDHFLPLVHTLAQFDSTESVEFFNEGIELGSISMRSFISR